MELPANRALFFVALDENDLAVKRMQSFLTVMPGEVTSCTGCHEDRAMAATDMPAAQALQRPARKPQPIPGMPEIIDYPRDIQPIWNKYCLDCHNMDKFEGRCQLHGDQGPMFTISYFELTRRFQMADGRNQYRGNLSPRSIGSVASPLMNKLDGSHYDVKLDARSLRLIKLWLDASATHPGTYAAMGSGLIGQFHESRAESNTHPDHKLAEVQSMRKVLGGRCRTCHPMSDCASDEGNINPTQVKYYNWKSQFTYPLPWIRDGQAPADYYDDVGSVRWMKKYMPEDFWYYRHIAFNLTRPEKSLALLAPLAKGAGGHGTCPDQFQDKDDPDYETILAGIEATKELLNELTRFNMKPFVPRPEYVREMKRFGILPQDHDPKTPIDPYETDREYWESLWWSPNSEGVDQSLHLRRRPGGWP
jgi:hypothetical protein